MKLLAVAAIAAMGAAPGPAMGPLGTALPADPIALRGRPLRVAAVERAGSVDVLLLEGRELRRFRLDGRTLVETAAFRSPAKSARPLLLDAAPNPEGGAPLVAVVFGDDVGGVDQGADTRLQAFVLSAGDDGGLRASSDDLRAYLRIAGGKVVMQRRGAGALVEGGVHPLEEAAGRLAPSREELPWGGRWLLDATPFRGGAEALAWDGDRPIAVKLQGGATISEGGILGDLGHVDDPRIAIRVDRPMIRGIDAEGNTLDRTRPLPRRVSVGADGAAYTVLRERSKRFLGRATGQDAVVRLDGSGGVISLSRPFPGVDAFVLDFALIERAGAAPAALLLVSDDEHGSGRASLVFQEPR